MVVDDHPVVRAGLVAIISAQADMEVIAQAGNGQAAIEQFRQHRPGVTLMDLRLPILGGVEAIAALRREFPSGRFIVLTTYEGDADINRALNAGAQGYVLKGITEGTVKSFVNSILGKLGVRDRTQAVTTALQRGLAHL